MCGSEVRAPQEVAKRKSVFKVKLGHFSIFQEREVGGREGIIFMHESKSSASFPCLRLGVMHHSN